VLSLVLVQLELFPLSFGYDLFLDASRRLLVMGKLHRVGRTALRRGAQIGRVSEHLGERHVRFNHLRPAGCFFGGLDHPTPPHQIAVDGSQIVLRRGHFNGHDRFEQDRTGRLIRLAKRHRAGDFERDLR
jgi:hypothetical protein